MRLYNYIMLLCKYFIKENSSKYLDFLKKIKMKR